MFIEFELVGTISYEIQPCPNDQIPWGNYKLGMIFSPLIRVNPSLPRQNGRFFADDIFKWILINENVCNSIQMSIKFVYKGVQLTMSQHWFK